MWLVHWYLPVSAEGLVDGSRGVAAPRGHFLCSGLSYRRSVRALTPFAGGRVVSLRGREEDVTTAVASANRGAKVRSPCGGESSFGQDARACIGWACVTAPSLLANDTGTRIRGTAPRGAAAARLPLRGPWLCVPASRRVCLCRGTVAACRQATDFCTYTLHMPPPRRKIHPLGGKGTQGQASTCRDGLGAVDKANARRSPRDPENAEIEE
jgi:hypothetical protein